MLAWLKKQKGKNPRGISVRVPQPCQSPPCVNSEVQPLARLMARDLCRRENRTSVWTYLARLTIVGTTGLSFLRILTHLVIGRLLIESGRASFESFCLCPTKREAIFETKYPQEHKRRNVFITSDLVMPEIQQDDPSHAGLELRLLDPESWALTTKPPRVSN